MDTSAYLLSPWVYYPVLGCALALFIVVVAWSLRALRHPVVWGLVALVVGAGVALGAFFSLSDSYDITELPVAAMVYLGLAVAGAVFGFKVVTRGWRGVILYVAYALVAALFIGLSVNLFYGYFPTVGAMFQTETVETLKPRKVVSPANETRPLHKQKPVPATNTAGTVITVQIPGTKSGYKARPAHVYLPPAYADNPDADFPVLVMLSGFPGSPEDWLIGGGLARTMDTYAASHNGLAPVVVLPDHNDAHGGASGCVDNPRIGNVDTYLSVDVPAYVESTLNVAKPGRYWAIGGLSEGGQCAVTTVLRHPAVYSTFLNYSGDAHPVTGSKKRPELDYFFGGDAKKMKSYDADHLLQNGHFKGLSGRFVIGARDSQKLIRDMQATFTLAKKKGLDVAYKTVPGAAHDFPFWRQSLSDDMPWLGARLGIVAG